MPNSLLDLYRKYNEENGIVDDTPDYFVVKDVLGPMAQKDPRIREAFPDFAKEYDAIREANSPGTFGGLKNTARTAFDRSQQALNVIGGNVDVDDVARLEREVQARPSSVPWEDWQRTEGEEARKVFMRDPVEITANIITSGFTGSLPALAGGLSLGAAGALAGPAGGIAGAAIGTGAGSLAVEYGSKYLDVLRDEGADLTNPESIQRILEDPEVRAKARGLAFRRGIPVAVFDAASAGLAGRLFKGFTGATRGQIVRQGLAEGAVQGALGGGGEVAGALTAGERISPGAVFEEIVGEAGPALVEVGGAAMRRNITDRPATPGAGPAGGLAAPNRMEDPVVEPEEEAPARPAVRTNREAVLAAYAIPDEQVAARVAELQALPVLSADQNVELEILLSRAPATPVVEAPPEQPTVVPPVTTPVASETAAAAPGFSILPAAPTPLAADPLVETPAAVGAPVGVPAPGSVEQPSPAAAVQPVPLQYTIQRPQEFEGRLIPGYVQIERTIDARGEPLTDAERAAAPQPPEWLPTGQYTEQQVLEAIAKGPPTPQPAQPDVQIPEPVIPQAPVAEADAAVRLLDPDQQVAQPVEQAGVEPAGEVPVVPPEPVQEPVVVTPFDEWEKAQRDYRARLINDEEFLAARAKWDAVQKAFDESRGELPPAASLPAEPEAPAAELSPEAKLALWKKQNSKPTGRRLQFSYLPDGTPDLLNQIHEAGGIRPPGPDERGGEYNEFGDIFSGSWKILVRKSGGRIEQVAQELGYDDVEKFKRAVEAAKVLRKKEFARFEMQSKEEAFTKVVLEGKGRAKDKVGKPESADTLYRGDRFKADKESFEVVDILENGDVLVNDGPKFGTQRIPAGATFYPDRRTLRRVPRKEASFLDEEDLPPVAPESAPAEDLPPKEAAPIVAATPDLPKPTELTPTVPSAALTPDEKAAVELAQVPGVEPAALTAELLAKQTFNELAGQSIDLNGEQLDAAEAWADTQKALAVYRKLLNCLKT